MADLPGSGRPAARDPIAIVGIGCRFPGATGPAEFWRLLCEGRVAIGEIPPSRFDGDRYFDPRPATPGRIMSRRGGFIDNAELFDADFFGVSPREAERLDPQQRWLLETAWEALEDAGLLPARLAGTQTGVFVGMWINEYEARMFRDPRALDFYMTTGSGRYAASGRLSYFFGLQGPSFTVDSGCSASLVSVHLACQSLWAGESRVALAAAANAILEPSVTIAYSQSRMMAPDGLCKFGDARADGYVRSEGAAVVVLKPLAHALADGDRVYATILGSSVNNDGRSSGFMTTPGAAGQEEMLRLAYRQAGVAPGRASYVEAHGTGTRAGDPVEINALGTVLAEQRDPSSRCRIGSLKTNIGHTEGAAGLAGLIKVALSLHHRTLPPSLHFDEPNPDIDWEALPLQVQQTLEPWPAGAESLIAGVSSFGIAGTNAHVVMQSVACERAAEPDPARRPLLLPLSGHTAPALMSRAKQLHDVLREPDASIADICWTAAVQRTHHAFRLAVAGRDADDLASQLESVIAGESSVAQGRRRHDRRDRIVFVFPGQGSQWLGMGRQLAETEPAFRAAIERCDEAIQTEAGWSIVAMLQAAEDDARLRQIDVIQPLLFSIEVALAALWRSWGFEPDAVVGHSMGEVAAVHVAGGLSLEDAVAVICRRSRLLLSTSGRGAMALVELTMAEAHEALRGREALLSVAVSNSSRSTVISGDPAALDGLLEELESREVFCRRVKVDVASHSPQMDPLQPELLAALTQLRPKRGSVPIYSTVDGTVVDGSKCDASYWVQNLRAPVLFSDAVGRLLAGGHDTFIEMSPHPILVPAVQEAISAAGTDAVVVGSTRRDEDEGLALAGSLAALYTSGVDVPFERFSTGRQVDLPLYPWQRERFWFEAPSQLDLVVGRRAGDTELTGNHPLLQARTELAGSALSIWEFALDVQTVVSASTAGGSAMFVPFSIYVELMLSSARVLVGDAVALSDLVLGRPQPVPQAGAPCAMQIVVEPDASGDYVCRIFSRDGAGWDERASARITAASPLTQTPVPTLRALGDITSSDDDPSKSALSVLPIHLERALRMLAPDLETAGCYPVAIRKVTVPADARQRPAVTAHQTLHGGLLLADQAGEPTILVEGVEVGVVDRAPGGISDWLHQLSWHSLPVASVTAVRGRVLVIGVDSLLTRGIVGALGERGADAVRIDSGQLSDALGRHNISGEVTLVHVTSPEAGDVPDVAWRAMRTARATVDGAIAAQARGVLPRVWFVTVQAHAVTSDETPSCAYAPVWGLGRVVAEEYPELWGGAIDLDGALDADAAASAVREALEAGDNEDQVAYRGGGRLVLRLTRGASMERLRIGPRGVYLVTGGLGALGLAVAGALVAQGARSLILLSRRSVPRTSAASADDPRALAIRQLEAKGATVETVAADVADREEMAALFTRCAATGRPIAGVVHCAGVNEGQLLNTVDEDAIARVWQAKVTGTWALLDAIRSSPVDSFVLFSSMASFLPSPGQAAYASANAFLDSAAAYARAIGVPALSINWGPWAGVGMAAELEARGGLNVRARGMASLDVDQGLAAFQRTAGGRHSAQLAVLPFDARRWRAGSRMPILTELVADATADVDETRDEGLRPQLESAATGAERLAAIEAYLTGVVARVTKRPASRIELTAPLRSLGLDSLMALELRNRLEAEAGVRLPATLAWNYPTINVMAPFLAARMNIALDDRLSEPAAADDLEALLAEIEGMSDEEARRLAFDGQ